MNSDKNINHNAFVYNFSHKYLKKNTHNENKQTHKMHKQSANISHHNKLLKAPQKQKNTKTMQTGSKKAYNDSINNILHKHLIKCKTV